MNGKYSFYFLKAIGHILILIYLGSVPIFIAEGLINVTRPTRGEVGRHKKRKDEQSTIGVRVLPATRCPSRGGPDIIVEIVVVVVVVVLVVVLVLVLVVVKIDHQNELSITDAMMIGYPIST